VKTIIHWRIVAGFALALLILATGGVLLYRSTREFRITRVQVRNNRDLLDALQSYLSCAQDAETGERGYLLTGNETYLEPYNRAVSEIDARVNRIEAMLAKDPSRQSAVAELRRRTQEEMEALREGIQLRGASGLDTSRVTAVAAAGKQEMDAIRAAVAGLQQFETQSLDRNRQRYEAGIVQRDRLFAGGIALQLVLLTLLFVVIYRDTAHRARSSFEVLQGNLRLSAILKTMGEGLYQVDRNGKLVYLNPAGEKLLGYKKEEILGRVMHDLIHSRADGAAPCSREECPLVTFPTKGSSYHGSNERFLRKDGSVLAVEFTSSPLIRYGENHGAVLVFRDTTERNRMEQALRDSEERYRNLIQKSRGLICTHDMEGKLLSVNEASVESLGYTARELEGKNLRELLAPTFRDKLDWYLKAIAEWGAHSGFMRVVTKDGNEIVWSHSNRVIQDPGSPPYVLGNAHDVTAQILAEEALKTSEDRLQLALEIEKNVSRVDFLTGIPNRKTFYEAVETEVHRAVRYRRPMTLSYIDVDNFKSVNDVLGHAAGDDLLKVVATTIQVALRRTDTVARLGGDEFAVLLPETSAEAAGVAVGKVQRSLQEAVSRHSLPITFSVGVVTYTTPLESVEQMIKRADELMYQVKRNGKSAVVCEVV
jgi:diguanylate cyclase (GGDEF)-like protein/PAS domain S-box-containing protein